MMRESSASMAPYPIVGVMAVSIRPQTNAAGGGTQHEFSRGGAGTYNVLAANGRARPITDREHRLEAALFLKSTVEKVIAGSSMDINGS